MAVVGVGDILVAVRVAGAILVAVGVVGAVVAVGEVGTVGTVVRYVVTTLH